MDKKKLVNELFWISYILFFEDVPNKISKFENRFPGLF
jgi:hypothetical protein